VDLVDFKTARFYATVVYLTYVKPALYSAAVDLTNIVVLFWSWIFVLFRILRRKGNFYDDIEEMFPL